MAMLSSMVNFQLFKPLPSISNNKNSSSCVVGRNSLHVCKNSSPPSAIPFRYTPKPPVIKTNKLLLRRFSGNTDGIPYFTTLSTPAGSNNWPITQHNDYLPFPKTSPYLVEVVGSCDGLVCLADGSDEGLAAIWNPSTNDYRILPGSSIQRPPSAALSIYPSCGFGFDPKSQDYKMVRFVNFNFEEDGYYDHTEFHVEVYSLKTDSWREVNPPDFRGVSYFTSTTIDGRCYWLAQSDSGLILCFDFSTEEFLPRIPLPRGIMGNDWREILEFDGSLALLNWNVSKRGEFNVWVLKNGSWSHVSVIRHSSNLRRPIGFVGNDKLFFEGEDSELLVYDCAAREMKSLGIYDQEDAMTIVPYGADNYSYSATLLNGESSSASLCSPLILKKSPQKRLVVAKAKAYTTNNNLQDFLKWQNEYLRVVKVRSAIDEGAIISALSSCTKPFFLKLVLQFCVAVCNEGKPSFSNPPPPDAGGVTVHAFFLQDVNDTMYVTSNPPKVMNRSTWYGSIHHLMYVFQEFWPDMRNYKNMTSMKKILEHEWKKHGQHSGFIPKVYFELTLLLTCTLPRDLGIPINLPMTILQAATLVSDVLDRQVVPNLIAGSVALPQVNCNTSRYGVRQIKEIWICYQILKASGTVKPIDCPNRIAGECSSIWDSVIVPK